MLARLSESSWQGSKYDRSAVRCGVVHLGLGAFHRAHQAPVFDHLVAGGDARWGVTGVAMRSERLVETLRAQDGLYSLFTRGNDDVAPRVLGVMKALLVAAREPQEVIRALVDEDTHLVTLTVTEKGYLDHSPMGPAGLIAQALERRRRQGRAPLTVLSCDNLSHNGAVARQAVLQAARRLGVGQTGCAWIEHSVQYPSSMVDRITPASSAYVIDESSRALGLQDEAAVWTESFWQWVLEDRFAAVRPDLNRAGVQLVADVAPWEKAKLRLLNAAHSALAYLGLERGHRYVHEAIADAGLARLIERLWDEASQGLNRQVVDVERYRVRLLRRFSSPALPHALLQIAADGSQKLPQRILCTMRERAALGLASPALATAVAAWAHALAGIDGLSDPLLERLTGIARAHGPGAITMRRLLECIDAGAAANPRIVEETARELDRMRHGSR